MLCEILSLGLRRLEPAVNRTAMDPDPFGEGFDCASLLQVNFNHLLALRGQVKLSRGWDTARVDEIQLRNILQSFWGDEWRVAEHMKPLNNGPQLPNISWPRMPHETLDRLWVELKGGGAVNPAEFFVESPDETCDFVSSLSEGWNFHSDDIKPVEQVFAK